MMLNSKQTIANTIPSIARVSKTTMSSSLKVFVMLMGVPSGGTPPVLSMTSNTEKRYDDVLYLVDTSLRKDVIITNT